MNGSLNRTDLEEIDAFFEEFSGVGPEAGEVSIDTLIDQLEASFETVEILTASPDTPAEQSDLNERVEALAQQLDAIATELAQIHQQLKAEG
ncbi:hypothetical protein [Thalassobius sp. Cn5-15]|jgi:flagellar hook-associated protein FlgK|uniref:hypothetical protein n=1 Tax=Thalassobius sp. Cn5-15 TaxID=2917763 RepID=UPI001EF22D97|nr:hypothetical protein [Thalassobius sp. Cn5-15]MCG7491965.1 hypothetical protein [Thalassobius sp. Cn5-15]